ncbi:MAG: thioredoxin domain-containing protein [Patescibacteria group bacterium]|jgi:protein-disulfide isomerase
MENENQNLTKRQRREMRKQEKSVQQQKEKRNNKITVWLVVLFIILVIGGVIFLVVKSNKDSNSNTNNSVSTADLPYLGGANAGVVMIEYSDFSCPACAAVSGTVKQLADLYGDQIKIVFNSFNLGHKWSEKSLEAGQCAFEQGKFWELGALMFDSQADWTSDNGAVDIIKGYAKQVGLDETKFNECLDSGRMADEIKKETNAAISSSINSTPTFSINGRKILGAVAIDEFKKIIDEELNKLK